MATIRPVNLRIEGPLIERRRFETMTNIHPAVYAGDWVLGATSPLVPIVIAGFLNPLPLVPSALQLEFHGIVPIPPGLLLCSYVFPSSGIDGQRWERANWSCSRENLHAHGERFKGGLFYRIFARRPPIRFIFAASRAFPTLTFKFTVGWSPKRVWQIRAGHVL